MPDIVQIAAADPREAAALLARSGFGPEVDRLLRFPVDSDAGTVLAVARGGVLVAVAGAVSFGASGWIGALAVAPEHRGIGLGREACLAATSWLRERGAVTVLLHATPMGRPMYAHMGFTPERAATAWRGTAPVRPAAPVRAMRADDRDKAARLDCAATGEDRRALLDGLDLTRGWCVENDAGGLRAAAIPSPYGRGVSIATDGEDPDAGLALVAWTCSGPASGVVLVPDANVAAVEALRRWRFTKANAPLRMRLGPPVAQQATHQFGLFNFFWG